MIFDKRKRAKNALVFNLFQRVFNEYSTQNAKNSALSLHGVFLAKIKRKKVKICTNYA